MKKVTLSLTFLAILAFVASSMTLWLLELSLKYVLYFFEVTLFLTLYQSLFGKSIETSLKLKKKPVNL